MAVKILVGDVFARLADLPDDHFDVVVTSPPYWGLRDYEVEGQIGLEPTLGEHLEVMVAVFEEVKRVLKPTGVVWLNYGDCYATSPNGRSAKDTKELGEDDRTFRDKPFSTVGPIYPKEARRNGGEGQHTDRRGPIYEAQPASRQAARRGRSGKLGNGGMNGDAIPAGRVFAGGYLKPKDLCMVPNRLAIALQEAGWWVRAEIVWGKLNPMPESIADRPATAHEKIFMLTKERRYFYDAAAVRSERTSDEDANGFRGGSYVDGEPGPRTTTGNVRLPEVGGWAKGDTPHTAQAHARAKKQDATAASAESAGASSGRRMAGFNERWKEAEKSRRNSFARTTKDSPGEHGQKPQFRPDREPVDYGGGGRNLRNYEPAPLDVWPMATHPFKEAHFATFPPELAARCLAAAPKRCCGVCGAPWEREVKETFAQSANHGPGSKALKRGGRPGRADDKGERPHLTKSVETLGFHPTCVCAATDCVPARVLDPFGGSGTVALVAERMRVDCTLIELHPGYAEIARNRITAEVGMLAPVEVVCP